MCMGWQDLMVCNSRRFLQDDVAGQPPCWLGPLSFFMFLQFRPPFSTSTQYATAECCHYTEKNKTIRFLFNSSFIVSLLFNHHFLINASDKHCKQGKLTGIQTNSILLMGFRISLNCRNSTCSNLQFRLPNFMDQILISQSEIFFKQPL